jgi:hypothetical protein
MLLTNQALMRDSTILSMEISSSMAFDSITLAFYFHELTPLSTPAVWLLPKISQWANFLTVVPLSTS